MYKNKKQYGMSAVPVVVILMLIAVVVGIITYHVALNVSGYSVNGTYGAYETLTGNKIPPKNLPGSIFGGVGGYDADSDGHVGPAGGQGGSVGSGNTSGGYRPEIPGQAGSGGSTSGGSDESPDAPIIPTPETKIYRIYTTFMFAPKFRPMDLYMPDYPAYMFSNGKTRLCTTYVGNYDNMTYTAFLKDDKAHPLFDWSQGLFDTIGQLYLENQTPVSIEPGRDIINGIGAGIDISETINWVHDPVNNEYYAEMVIISHDYFADAMAYILEISIWDSIYQDMGEEELVFISSPKYQTNYTVKSFLTEMGVTSHFSEDFSKVKLGNEERDVIGAEMYYGDVTRGTINEIMNSSMQWEQDEFDDVIGLCYNEIHLYTGEITKTPQNIQGLYAGLSIPSQWYGNGMAWPSEQFNATYNDLLHSEELMGDYYYDEATNQLFLQTDDGLGNKTHLPVGTVKYITSSRFEKIYPENFNDQVEWINYGDGYYDTYTEIYVSLPEPDENSMFYFELSIYDELGNYYRLDNYDRSTSLTIGSSSNLIGLTYEEILNNYQFHEDVVYHGDGCFGIDGYHNDYLVSAIDLESEIDPKTLNDEIAWTYDAFENEYYAWLHVDCRDYALDVEPYIIEVQFIDSETGEEYYFERVAMPMSFGGSESSDAFNKLHLRSENSGIYAKPTESMRYSDVLSWAANEWDYYFGFNKAEKTVSLDYPYNLFDIVSVNGQQDLNQKVEWHHGEYKYYGDTYDMYATVKVEVDSALAEDEFMIMFSYRDEICKTYKKPTEEMTWEEWLLATELHPDFKVDNLHSYEYEWDNSRYDYCQLYFRVPGTDDYQRVGDIFEIHQKYSDLDVYYEDLPYRGHEYFTRTMSTEGMPVIDYGFPE